MRNTIFRLFKSTLVLSLSTLLLASCGGGKNTSGGKSKIDPLAGGGVIAGGNGQVLPSNWRNVVRQENPCISGGGTRRVVSFPVQTNANVGAIYVGVTSEGDIAYINNNNGTTTLTVEVCQRPDLGNGGQVAQKIVVNNSYYCPVGEITEAYLSLKGNYGQYTLALRPIHVPGYVHSSLCH